VPSTRSHRLLFIGYDNGGDAHLLRLRGLLDLRTAGLLAAALGELERASAFDVVLDLDAVTSCDGTALAVILGGARRLERAGRRLQIAAASDAVSAAMAKTRTAKHLSLDGPGRLALAA